MIIERRWAMPSASTFEIKPISKLLDHEIKGGVWVDPFARDSKRGNITNDINKKTSAQFHYDALTFLKTLKTGFYDGVLFDPPYSLRQVKECYQGIGQDLTSHESRYFFSDLKKEIARIVKPGGKVISFGWNSGGIGNNNGFEIVRILMVAHGGPHNDTIVTIDKKVQTTLSNLLEGN